MKAVFIVTALLIVATPVAAECIRTPAGRTVCRDAAGQVVAAPPAATAPVAVAPGGVAVVPGAVGATRYSRTYSPGVSTVETANGRAAYNPHTGNAAVSQTNANGVTTTQTSRGGEAKTKNGMGVAHGAGGTTCVKGRGSGKCN